MTRPVSFIARTLLLAVFTAPVAFPTWADKPASAGEKGNKHERADRSKGGTERRASRDADTPRQLTQFQDQHREVVRRYYDAEFRGGHCPPGLSKKNNGCMPPGQAKKWKVGRPLPRDVIYYDVPRSLVVEIGLPPAGYRYVRVATDILMIAIGTGMVMDAIQDLGRM